MIYYNQMLFYLDLADRESLLQIKCMNISEVASNYSFALIDSCSGKNEVEKLFDELNIFLELYKNNN